jgi:hypothetical protein
MRRLLGVLALAVSLAWTMSIAWAGVEDWRINEVVASANGDPTIRFIELYAPPSPMADNCFYASTVIEVLDADANLLGSTAPNPAGIQCFPGDTYYIFATNEASAFFGEWKDRGLTTSIPMDAGQICLKSSTTRYDCVRWGNVTNPVVDLTGPADISSAVQFQDGMALARVQDTDVVQNDFVLQGPTMRGPNDGGVWTGAPDASLPPDADTTPDASMIDARVFADVIVPPRIDAREGEPAWYGADPGGGAAITCSVAVGTRSHQAPYLLAAALLIVVIRRRSRR